MVGWVFARSKLAAGDWVEVRSKEDILATLDANGRLDNLPFMPEMFEYCGRRFRVWKRAHKTCDTVDKTGGRRVSDAVHLEDSRCSGKAHGSCEAACLLFWKEAWLKRVNGSDRTSARPPSRVVSGCDESMVRDATQAPGSSASDPTYECQATLLPQFSSPLPWWDFRQYLDDYRWGNATLEQLLSGAAYVVFFALAKPGQRIRRRLSPALIRLYDRWQSLREGVPFPRRKGSIPPGEETPSPPPLNLQPGEWVRVRSYPEILATLNTNNMNRGLYFDAEEVPYCGGTYRVRSRVSKIIDEKTGKMRVFKTPAVILEGVYCQARYSDRRMFCPRAILPFWRDAWLERAQPRDKRGNGGPAS